MTRIFRDEFRMATRRWRCRSEPPPTPWPTEELPPNEIRIRLGTGVVPLIRFLGEIEEHGVSVSEQDVKPILAFVVVPLAPGIVLVPIGPDCPVPLDQLVGRAQGD